MTPLFSTTDVSHRIGTRTILSQITLGLRQGRMTALLGHNGSGKSTLLKVLARQIGPSTGKVVTLGRPQAEWSNRDHARAVAYLPQYTPAAEGMTVKELVALGRYPWHGALGRPGPNDHAAIAAALTDCAVTSMADRLVDTLSGGERQRVWLAMMLAQGAQVLLLDEPISALDIVHQVEVLSLVRRLCDAGRSVVVVLHDVNMAARFCDDVVALRQGHVVFQGSASQLMTAETLGAIYGLPMQVISRDGASTIAMPV